MADDADRSPGYKAFVIAMIAMTIAATVLRFLSRSISTSSSQYTYLRFWWDDWIALAAATKVITVALQVILFRFVEDAGFGHHQSTLSDEQVTTFYKLLFIGDYFFDLSLVLSKQSALMFLSRVFPRIARPRWLTIGIWTTSGANIAWLIGTWVGTILFCDPIAKNWYPTLPGRCGTLQNLFIGSVTSSVVIDVAILVLPLPMIWGLQANRARRGAITAVFVLGYCVIIVSLGRLITLVVSAEAIEADITYEGVPFFYWVAAEAPVTILSVCLPAMLPLGRHIVRHYFGPLTEKLSSFLSTGSFSSCGSSGGALRSISGNFGHARDRNGITLSNHSGESRVGVLCLSASDDNYRAHIRKGDSPPTTGNDIPLHSIRVDNDIRVSRGKNGSSTEKREIV
ncbi:hypothetical protein F4818DRAFT_439786 [Hypoxylon cercidicola]|nr:hypothetical protein F4818DRAFT_439786 [Hypoxylon cercidicola]